MEIHKETGFSRVTIDKYIKLIETSVSNGKSNGILEILPTELECSIDIFPQSYIHRKKEL